MSEKQFIGGFYPKPKHDKTPSFIHSKGSFNVDQALDYFTKKKNEGVEWVNYQVKSTKADENKWYGEEDDWKPEGEKKPEASKPLQDNETIDYPEEDINPEDIPF
jgi:hypothetical protein